VRSGFAVFRADGGPRIGLGHLMRVSAVARHMAQDGFRCGFAVSAETAAHAAGVLGSLGEIAVLEAPASAAELRRVWPDGCEWLVVDHYELGDEFERACAGWAVRIAVFDDAPGRHHACDALIDGAVDRDPLLYRRLVPDAARRLCGSAYLPLRDDFFSLRSSGAPARRFAAAPGERRLFMSLGGGDTAGPLSHLLDILARSRFPWPVDVCAMGAAPQMRQLGPRVERLAPGSRLHLASTNLAPLIAGAWAGLGAGGTASYERAVLGLPSVIVEVAANQQGNAAAFADREAAFSLGPVDAVAAETVVDALIRLFDDDELHRAMSGNALRIADGLGARRVALELLPERDARSRAITLRPATPDDCESMLQWQSEPGARRFARNPTAPTRPEHAAWLDRTLADPQSLLNVIVADGRPVGVLRLDRKPSGDWEVSILVAGEARSHGIGRAALAATRRLLPDANLIAEIHPVNTASHRLFRAAGYRRTGAAHARGQVAIYVHPSCERHLADAW
jgi:UDP-2,4-diacetamido-2,4,6-trideoxy-beta-L-altropyranose hydrolase